MSQKTKPIVISISTKSPSFYWFKGKSRRENDTDCFKGALVTIRETKTFCDEKFRMDTSQHSKIVYNITEVLGFLFQAGFYSCFLSLTINQPNIDENCQLILHYSSQVFWGRSLDDFAKYPGLKFWTEEKTEIHTTLASNHYR